jgi:hypothetical protein
MALWWEPRRYLQCSSEQRRDLTRKQVLGRTSLQVESRVLTACKPLATGA